MKILHFFVDNIQKIGYNIICRLMEFFSVIKGEPLMGKNMEIERKFLIEMPEIPAADITRRLDIVQIYLNDGVNGCQRRIRKITENMKDTFMYTEKTFYSPIVRNEIETEINEKQYNEFKCEARNNCSTVIKTRVCFNHLSQLFELDMYPFSDKLAILELELDDPLQDIHFPEYVKVIKEVSDDSRYSNAALCTAGKFPSEAS